MAIKKQAAATAEEKFNKKQIVSSRRYVGRTDIVNALLDDAKKYSFDEVDKMIDAYMRKEVK